MKKILIPIDFTRSSNNAIAYAVALTNTTHINQIILVVNDYISEFEQLIPSADFIQLSIDRVQTIDGQLSAQFEELKTTIFRKLNPGVRISFILSKKPLLRSLRELMEKEKPDLLLIGSNHAGVMDESYISDHLIKIARSSTVPVLIVPSQARYQKTNKVLIPFNDSNFMSIGTLNHLNNIKDWTHPEFLLLNVAATSDQTIKNDLTNEVEKELREHLSHFKFHIYNSDEQDVLKGINYFSQEKDLQLIIALPGQHSFLYNLTHRSIIKGLARNNYKPVLILQHNN